MDDDWKAGLHEKGLLSWAEEVGLEFGYQRPGADPAKLVHWLLNNRPQEGELLH